MLLCNCIPAPHHQPTMIYAVAMALALIYAYRRMQYAKVYPMVDPINPNNNDHPLLTSYEETVQHQYTNDELQTHYDMMTEIAYPERLNRAVGPMEEAVEVDWTGIVRKAQQLLGMNQTKLMHPLYTTYG